MAIIRLPFLPDNSTTALNESFQMTVKAGGVGTTQLADESVTTGKLDDGSVTAAKLHADIAAVAGGAASNADTLHTHGGLSPTVYTATGIGCVADCNVLTGEKVGGVGTPTDNAATINALLATASSDNPIKLIVDGGFAIGSPILIPYSRPGVGDGTGGHVTIEFAAGGSGFFALDGMNESLIKNLHPSPEPSEIVRPLYISSSVIEDNAINATELLDVAFATQGLDENGSEVFKATISEVDWYVSYDYTNDRWLISNAEGAVGTGKAWEISAVDKETVKPVSVAWQPVAASGATGVATTVIGERICGRNIAIVGPGLIHGNAVGNSTGTIKQGIDGVNWFYCINLHAVENLTLRDFKILDSPSFGANIMACRDVKCDHVTFENTQFGGPGQVSGANTDGLHFTGGCHYLHVSNCTFIGMEDNALAFNFGEGDANGGGHVVVDHCLFDHCTVAFLSIRAGNVIPETTQRLGPILINGLSGRCEIPGAIQYSVFPASNLDSTAANGYCRIDNMDVQGLTYNHANYGSLWMDFEGPPIANMAGNVFYESPWAWPVADSRMAPGSLYLGSNHAGALCYKGIDGGVRVIRGVGAAPTIATAKSTTQTGTLLAAVNGLYRLRAQAVCTTANAATLVDLVFSWTDNGGAKTASVPQLSLAAIGYQALDTLIHVVKTGTATADITYAATVSGAAVGTGRYGYAITIERVF